MLFQPQMHHQNKGKGVYFSLVISMYIYLYCLYSLCLCVFYLFGFIYELMAYSRQGGHKCLIWGTFFGKKGILFAHTPETDVIFKHF